MTSFLEKLTDELLKKHNGDLSRLCIVFPTRRAGVHFKKIFSTKLSIPAWSPSIYAIEDFIQSISQFEVPDQLDLVFELYEVYRKYFPSESFDRFYPWGVMLLSDFDDADSSMAKTEQLFSYIKDLKTIDEQFELAEEDRNRIHEFWKLFFGKEPGDLRKNFLDNWKHLGSIYAEFKSALLKKNLAYAGLATRLVADSLQKEEVNFPFDHIVFAGFNALSKAEQSIIDFFLKNGKGSVYYDSDEYYVDDPKQEAGTFLRKKDLTHWKESLLANDEKKIEVIGVPLQSLQAKVAGQILYEHPDIASTEKTAIVLPDEQLLMPVLYSLPSSVQDVNVTMGYPLHASPLFTLIESLFDLQKSIRIPVKSAPASFYFKNILSILQHPYLYNLHHQEVSKWMENYRANLWIRISEDDLQKDTSPLFRSVFRKVESMEDWLKYFDSFFSLLIDAIRKNKEGIHALEKEYVYYFYTRFKKLEEIIGKFNAEITVDTFRSLFREVIHSTRIPFTGEPLKGLQVMGFLETRVLDFENLVILSLNEDILPPSSRHPSFIPYNIRKAFGLPAYEEHNAIASYHFYRLLQRAKNIFLIYNTEVKSFQGGEKSRYLLQIENELLKRNKKITYVTRTADLSLAESNVRPVIVVKSADVIKELQSYFQPARSPLKFAKKFSASALIQYIACPLRFYFQYVSRLKEQEEAEEIIEAGLFGTILHEAMHTLYTPFKVISKNDFKIIKTQIEKAIDEAIGIYFGPARNLEGKNILMRNVLNELISQIVSFDEANAPLQIKYLEAEFGMSFKINGNTVTLYGIIDRVDLNDHQLQVVDYKTGKGDDKIATTPDQLFTSPDYKEQFQTFFYAWLLHQKESMPVKAGLFRLREISRGVVYINKGAAIAEEQFSDFELHLRKLLEEIFNPEVPFRQTDDLKQCLYCSFKNICNR